MDEEIDDFLSAADKNASAEIEKNITGLQRSTLRIIGQLPTKPGGRVAASDVVVATRAAAKKVLIASEIQLTRNTGVLINTFDGIQQFLLVTYLLTELKDVDEAQIDGILSAQIGEYKTLHESEVSKVIKELLIMTVDAGDIEDLEDRIIDIFTGAGKGKDRGFLGRSKVLLTDAVREFHGAVNLVTAKRAGVDRFKYFGSIQHNTREFCRRFAGKQFDLDEINELGKFDWSGKKSDNVLIHRGGFNCRHHWVPIVE